jgi:hypothetical protein
MQTASLPAQEPEDPQAWAKRLGQRLSYLQARLARDPPEQRRASLEDELRRALLGIPEAQRGAFLDALSARFPSWELATLAVNSPAAIAKRTSTEIIKDFIALVPQLSESEREQVKRQLADLGVVGSSQDPFDAESRKDLQAKLKVSHEDPIEPQRLGKLFVALADTMASLDQLVWNVWRNMAPKSRIRHEKAEGDLRTLVRRSVTGDAEASAAQVQKQLEATRQLIAGIIAGLGPAGKTFADRYQERYAPDAIRAMIQAEGGASALFANAEARCWKKYTEISTEITQTSIETDVQDAVVKYVENLIRGSS